jgi:cysteinyl-tRNA synthetase
MINSVNDGKASINKDDLEKLQKFYKAFVFEILGLQAEETTAGSHNELLEGVMQTVLSLRAQAKQNKDWATADLIRNELNKLNIKVTDTKDGAVWEVD